MNFTIYLIIGAFSGTLAGLLGLGGGVIVVPALAAMFSYYQIIPQHQIMHMAIGTSLLTIVVTFTASIFSHARNRSIRWDFVKIMLPWVVVGAICGAILAKHLPTFYLRVLFSVFLFFTSAKLFFGAPIPEEKIIPSKIIIGLFATIAGILSGILGIGGGAVLIPFLLHCKFNIRQATGTAVVMGLAISIVASVSFMLLGMAAVNLPWSTGYIYWPAFLGIAISSILFAPLGTYFAYKLPAEPLKRVLAVFLLLVGIAML